jgi:hypothetical protein
MTGLICSKTTTTTNKDLFDYDEHMRQILDKAHTNPANANAVLTNMMQFFFWMVQVRHYQTGMTMMMHETMKNIRMTSTMTTMTFAHRLQVER